MVVRIAGKRMYLWRAVDHEGEILDVLVWMEHDNGYRAPAHASPKVAKSLNASIFSVIVSRSIMYPKKWTTEYVRCGRA